MSSMQMIHEQKPVFAMPAHDVRPPSASLLLALATMSGLGVATLYYSQPMLALIGAGLRVPDAMLGLVPMLTQLGYALGILFLAPLGDRVDRRRLILAKAAVLAAALLASGFATGIVPLLAASLVIGLAATIAQDIVSTSAALAPEESRGKVVGTIMTGLLLGILLSRVASGLIAQHFGWRVTFVAAAASIGLVLIIAGRFLPRIPPTTTLPYSALLGSLLDLWRRHEPLRRAALAQGLVAVGFSAFWSSLALMMHGAPFHLGSAATGAFGLAGAVGAVAAPLAGKLADRRGPEFITRAGTTLTAASFGVMLFAPLLPASWQLWLVALGVVGFDLGAQSTLIAHQTIVYGLEPAARSRLNAVLFVGMFSGMAVGAGLGGPLVVRAGWLSVAALAAVSALAALAVRLRASRADA